jgi:hypothetical protein
MGTTMDRRRALGQAAVGTVGAAAMLGTVAAQADAAAPTVRGSWVITPELPPSVPGFHALAAFAAGGVFITTGSDEPGTGIGEWVAQGKNGFAFSYQNFHFDGAGALANTVTVQATGTFSGSKLRGRATLTRVDPSGQPIGSAQQSSFTGRRMSAS